MPAKLGHAIRTRPWALAVALALAFLVANVIVRPSFAAWGSWPSTFAYFAPFALAAVAQTPALIAGGGGIDISIGPSLNFVSVLIVGVLLAHGVSSIWIVIPAALALGALVGLINGVLVTVLRYPPVLATLAMLFVITGVGLAILSEPASSTTGWLSSLGDMVGPIPGGLLLVLIPVVIWSLLGRLPFRKALYAVGGDAVAAYSAGVNITAVRIAAYTLGGLFAGIAGLSLAAATQTGDPSQATAYSLSAIVAVALGGTSLLGGRGSLSGSIAGAAIIFLIQTLMDSLHVSSNVPQLIFGLLLLFSIIVNSQLAGLVSVTGATSGGEA